MPASPEAFRWICGLAKSEASIELSEGKEYLVNARLEPVARKQGFASIDAMVAKMKASPSRQLTRSLVEGLTTHETLFFRDNHPFEALRREVFPKIIEKRRVFRNIRILSAACSTGQEPHTIRMLLREHFPELNDWSIRFVATDFSEQVLERAREGKYRQLEVARGLPAVYLAKYFKRCGADWQVKPEIRDAIEFQQQNITAPWVGMGVFDLVLVRNVLIYFSDETKAFVLTQAAKALDADGYLMIGAAESMIGMDVPLEREGLGATSVYRPKGSRSKLAG